MKAPKPTHLSIRGLGYQGFLFRFPRKTLVESAARDALIVLSAGGKLLVLAGRVLVLYCARQAGPKVKEFSQSVQP